MVPGRGFEPRFCAPEAHVLPLDDPGVPEKDNTKFPQIEVPPIALATGGTDFGEPKSRRRRSRCKLASSRRMFTRLKIERELDCLGCTAPDAFESNCVFLHRRDLELGEWCGADELFIDVHLRLRRRAECNFRHRKRWFLFRSLFRDWNLDRKSVV